jgi:uncharacterized protein (DUF58 family)
MNARAAARRALELTGRGRVLAALAGASLLGAWLSGDPHVHLAAALLLAPLLLDLLANPRGLHRVRITAPPRRTTVGALFRDQIELAHDGRAPLRELQLAEPELRARPALVDALARGGRAQLALPCQSQHRGHRRERTFELLTEWPFGLFRRRARLTVAADLVTEPARIAVDARLLLAAGADEPADSTRVELAGDEFHALREHHVGEIARGVHALRSAALGQPVRAVRRGRAPRLVALIVDLRLPPGRRAGGQRRFEQRLGVAAAVLDDCRARGAIVRLVLFAAVAERLQVADAAAHRDALTRLSEVQPCAYGPIDPALLGELQVQETCYWIAAGGQRLPPEVARALPRLVLVGGER